MATAVCGLQSTGTNSKPARTHREPRRKVKDSRRRQAALLFLNNISLDGRPQPQLNDGNGNQKTAEDQRLGGRDGGAAAVPPPASNQAAVAQVTEPAGAGSGSSSSFPGLLSPTRPSLVMSPGPTGASAVGANEVFLEGGSAAEALTPDTPLSPVTAGHQHCSRVRSTPAALSPAPASNSVDLRQRWVHFSAFKSAADFRMKWKQQVSQQFTLSLKKWWDQHSAYSVWHVMCLYMFYSVTAL